MTLSRSFLMAAVLTSAFNVPSFANDTLSASSGTVDRFDPNAVLGGLELSPIEIQQGIRLDLFDASATIKTMFTGCNEKGVTFAMPLKTAFHMMEGSGPTLTTDQRLYHMKTVQMRATDALQAIANDPMQMRDFTYRAIEEDYLKALRDVSIAYYRETGLTFFFEAYKPMVLLPRCLEPTQIDAVAYDTGVTIRANFESSGYIPENIPNIIGADRRLPPPPKPI